MSEKTDDEKSIVSNVDVGWDGPEGDAARDYLAELPLLFCAMSDGTAELHIVDDRVHVIHIPYRGRAD